MLDAAVLSTYNFFKNAEEAWFWYCRCQALKDECAQPSIFTTRRPRPCSLSDIYICVVKLTLGGILKKRHINTLVKFGTLLHPPDYRIPEEAEASIWWDEALDKLESLMRERGFIAPPG